MDPLVAVQRFVFGKINGRLAIRLNSYLRRPHALRFAYILIRRPPDNLTFGLGQLRYAGSTGTINSTAIRANVIRLACMSIGRWILAIVKNHIIVMIGSKKNVKILLVTGESTNSR